LNFRRDHHNQLERKRRASIKTSYNDLREVIPGLRGSKASRAVILQRAVECIEELVKLNRDHTVCVETLKRQNDLLDSRVQELQRLVQRMDGEEACNTPTSSSFANTISPNNNVALRLISPTASGVPMYRCMSQDPLQSSTSTECIKLTAVLPTVFVLRDLDSSFTSNSPLVFIGIHVDFPDFIFHKCQVLVSANILPAIDIGHFPLFIQIKYPPQLSN
uniref:BHLH domain-containing protein n=1 Tax=Schistosoma curassoni TaxID=6186 RepID=A0A183L711_9TREM